MFYSSEMKNSGLNSDFAGLASFIQRFPKMHKRRDEMSKVTQCFAVGLFSVVLAGCATTPVPPSQATAVPDSRLYAFQQAATPDAASLVLTRDHGFIGSACYYALFINNTLAARFGQGEAATFYVKPSEVLLKYGRDPKGRGLCGTEKNQWSTKETIIKPEQTKHFRLTIDANGRPVVQRAD